MSSFRLAAQRLPAAALRPALARPMAARIAPAAPMAMRLYSDKPTPEAKASSFIDSLPGNSLVAKTTWITLGTGLSAVAISKELYVANEESVILAGFLVFTVLVGRMIAKPYGQWADGQIEVGIFGIRSVSRGAGVGTWKIRSSGPRWNR